MRNSTGFVGNNLDLNVEVSWYIRNLQYYQCHHWQYIYKTPCSLKISTSPFLTIWLTTYKERSQRTDPGNEVLYILLILD